MPQDRHPDRAPDRASEPSIESRFVSYAQNMEDVLLWRALRHISPGFYIDVGAADPTDLSVTRAFYDRGWSGLNVEPLPDQVARLRAARPRDTTVQAALGATEAPAIPFHRVTRDRQTGLSTLSRTEAEHHAAGGAAIEVIDVPATTLAALCRTHVHGPVHFLKIDAEGAEADILAGADFDPAHPASLRPWIVVVEATPPLEQATPTEPVWQAGLLAAGYRQVWFDGLNRFYLADEHQDLARHFQVPPNVFDDFVVHDPTLRRHLAETEALSARRMALIEALEARLAGHLDAAAPPATPPAAKPPADTLQPTPPAPPAAASDPAPPPGPPPAQPGGARALVRTLFLALYRPFRPLLRPIAWRSRQFLTGLLQQELDGLRIRLDQLVARPVNPPSSQHGGLDRSTFAALERALLTLALNDGRAAPGPLLLPASKPPAPSISSPKNDPE